MRTPLFFTLIFLSPLFVSVPLAEAEEYFSPFVIGKTLIVASSSPYNAYLAGLSVVHTGTVGGDLVSAGGSVLIAGEVRRDLLLVGGSLRVEEQVFGDLRAVGGSVESGGEVVGDFIAGGFSVDASGPIGGDAFVVGADVVLSGGAEGSVTIYGNTVVLGGIFDKHVHVIATNSIEIQDGARILGTLSYKAPNEVVIPESAEVANVEYTSASYLPDAGASRVLAVLSVVLFILIRILGALILAGLLAGLFPHIAESLVGRLYEGRLRNVLLSTLLGFGVLVATPALIIILLLTFVGIWLAILLFVLYALLCILAILYAGIVLGGLFARHVRKRGTVRWHDGILGMLALSIITLIPVGVFAALLIMMFSSGALLQIFFHFAFSHEEEKEV